jgi:lysophospholipase L1-like esterase
MKFLFILLFHSLLIVSPLYSQSIKPFKQGDRIAFVGNSITCGGHYHSYIWLYYMTHFPDMRIDIFNEGIGGDNAGLIYQRLDKVFDHEPTVVTLTFGMNDVGYMDFSQPGADSIARQRLDKTYTDYKQIEKIYNNYKNVAKILIGSSPYDETARFNRVAFPKKNEWIQQVGTFLENESKRNQWGFVDFNQPMVDINIREQASDSIFTLCGSDRIHPTADGHLVMAYLFLKAQGFSGKPVADIQIDAKKKVVEKAENCQISELAVDLNHVTFLYKANALPYPVSEVVYEKEKRIEADALKVIPFMDEINYEGLCVKGLPNGYYNLKINDIIIHRFTAQDLSRGINMAELKNTPQYLKAVIIMEMNERRWLKERQMREFFWVEYNLMRKTGMLWACNEAAVDTLRKYSPRDIYLRGNGEFWLKFRSKGMREDCEKEQQELINRIYDINKPETLKITISKL